jgi:hypothetical protein
VDPGAIDNPQSTPLQRWWPARLYYPGPKETNNWGRPAALCAPYEDWEDHHENEKIKDLLFAVLGVAVWIAAGQAAVAQGEPVWEATGLMGPESAVYNATSKILYVSNVNGGPMDRDGNGFISKLSLSTARWSRPNGSPG